MSKRPTQEEIDQLLKDSDQEIAQIQEEGKQKEGDEEYPQEFIEQTVNENEVEEQYKIEDEPEVESEIASQKFDEVSEHFEKESDFQFKKQEDLSEAQSQFIQSSRLNDGVGLKIKSNIKNTSNSQQVSKGIKKQNKNENLKEKDKAKVKVKSKGQQKPASKKVIEKKKKEQKVGVEQSIKDKAKLSQSQINRKMKEIEQDKKKRQQRKEEQKKKEQDVRRKQYEQAKLKEEQRKEKNKKILQEQRANKKVTPSSRVKIQPEQQVKIPEKPTEFKYMELKKEKMQNEKMIQKQIEQQNLIKLKKLNNNKPSELKGQAKKAAVLQERKSQLQRQKKQKAKEQKQQDVLIIKQIKRQIMECKQFNLEKNKEINRAEKNIDDLKKKVKEKEKYIYLSDGKEETNQRQRQSVGDIAELSPIQKFVYSFPQSKGIDQIFALIDQNGDGVLSSKEIYQKLTQFKLQKSVITKIQQILDENCDGTVSNQQFVFLVQLQLKRQKDLKQILGDLQIINPIDMQGKIVDMQAKIKYINRQIEKHKNSNQNEGYQQKLQKLQNKSDKIEHKIKKEITDFTKQGNSQDIGVNTVANLTNQYVKLKNQKTIKLNFLQKLRTKVKDNLEKKNKLLASRVEESLRLQEEVYKIKNEIQQRELRFLSLKKMQANKKGYVERQTQKRRQLQEAYKRTKQYQILIGDPAKKAQKGAQAFQMKFLAAVLMIQRNYRKKKARRQYQRLKGEGNNK